MSSCPDSGYRNHMGVAHPYCNKLLRLHTHVHCMYIPVCMCVHISKRYVSHVPTSVSEKRLSCFPHSFTLDLMGPSCREPAMVQIFTWERMGEKCTCREVMAMSAAKICQNEDSYSPSSFLFSLPFLSVSSTSLCSLLLFASPLPPSSFLLPPLSSYLSAYLTVVQQHLDVVCSSQDEHIL